MTNAADRPSFAHPNDQLTWALWAGDTDVAMEALGQGADPNHRIDDRRYQDLSTGGPQRIMAFHRHANIRPQDRMPVLPTLHYVLGRPQRRLRDDIRLELALALLNGGADVDQLHVPRAGDDSYQTPYGTRAIITAASDVQCVELVRLLLERGADPGGCHGQPGVHQTPLHALADQTYSVAKRDFALVPLLCQYHAPLDALDEQGLTPLMHALERGSHRLVQRLLEAGASMDVRNPKGLGVFQWMTQSPYLEDTHGREALEMVEHLHAAMQTPAWTTQAGWQGRLAHDAAQARQPLQAHFVSPQATSDRMRILFQEQWERLLHTLDAIPLSSQAQWMSP